MPKLGDTISPPHPRLSSNGRWSSGVAEAYHGLSVQITGVEPDGTATAVDLNTASPKIFVASVCRCRKSPLRSMSVFRSRSQIGLTRAVLPGTALPSE